MLCQLLGHPHEIIFIGLLVNTLFLTLDDENYFCKQGLECYQHNAAVT
jgi:hypothetical protein